jgi:pimeloyl-ACP methyl ester carboxylesterase
MVGIKTLSALALAISAAVAQQRITFTSSGTKIVGYHWSPSDVSTPAPVVIIAHGLGGLQTSRLQPYAERFSAAGYHAITFDYRYWGQSSGFPRNIIDVKSQQEDYTAAAAYVGNLTGVDASRVVLWGTSLSGGHVLELGARLPQLAAVIAQVPHVNGLATVSQLPPDSLPGLIATGLSDSGRSLVNSTPLYIPTANRTGQFGALTQAGAFEGYQFIQPNPPAPGNVFPARFVLQLPGFSPDTTAANSNHPTFIGIGLTDNVVSPNATLALARKFKTATVYNYTEAGHFDVYPTKPYFEQTVTEQVAFLKANVPV